MSDESFTWRGLPLKPSSQVHESYSFHRGHPGRIYVRVWRKAEGCHVANVTIGNLSGSAEVDGSREDALDAALVSARRAVTRHDELVSELENYGQQLGNAAGNG